MIVLMLFLHLGRADAGRDSADRRSRPWPPLISPWFFVVTLAIILGCRILVCPRCTGRGSGDSHQHHRDIPGAGRAGSFAERDQPGRAGLRRRHAGRQRGGGAGKHLPPLGPWGRRPLRPRFEAPRRSGGRSLFDADHGGRVSCPSSSCKKRPDNCSAISPWRSARRSSLSLVVSMTLIPMAAARLFARTTETSRVRPRRLTGQPNGSEMQRFTAVTGRATSIGPQRRRGDPTWRRTSLTPRQTG